MVHPDQDRLSFFQLAFTPEAFHLVLITFRRCFYILIQLLTDLPFRQRPVEFIQQLPLLHDLDVGQAAHLKMPRQFLLLFRIDLGQHKSPLIGLCQFLEDGGQLLARLTPVRPDVNDDGHGHGGFEHHLLKVLKRGIDNVLGIAHRVESCFGTIP